MQKFIQIYMVFILLSFCNDILCQPPNYVYEGGIGDGFESVIVTENYNNIFSGSTGDGFASFIVHPEISILYHGGIEDGYSSIDFNENILFIYTGGISDGFAQSLKFNEGSIFFKGGISQGYNQEWYCQEFIWTGTIGEGWNVPDNWNYSTIPDINRPVVIPSGVPNFPNVNAGILAIGKNPNEGAFVCKSIWIQTGGELYTRVNNFVENRGDIIIDGTMRVRNSAFNAFQNFQGGRVRVSPTGKLTIKP